MSSKAKEILEKIEKNFDKIYFSLFLTVACLAILLGGCSFINKNNKDEEDNNELQYEVILSNSIYLKNFPGNVFEHYFKDDFLYDNSGNKIDLVGFSAPIYFIRYNLNEETLNNMNLKMSNVKRITLDSSSISNDCINYLPSSVENLSLNYCNFITSLDNLPYVCPQIIKLSINGTGSLSDLDFIYNLKNLKQIEMSNSYLVTQELLDYLKENNIKTNITQKDVENSKTINEILTSIILPDMTDVEKIHSICFYVLENYGFDLKLDVESSKDPLNCMLDNKKGVCTGYSYLANILLNKAGIRSFSVRNLDHCWNIIELDNQFYYLDVTYMEGSSLRVLFEKIGDFKKNHLISTNGPFDNPITNPFDEETIIPRSLLEEIKLSNEKELTDFDDDFDGVSTRKK